MSRFDACEKPTWFYICFICVFTLCRLSNFHSTYHIGRHSCYTIPNL